MKSKPSLQQERQIRVFISSTFRDMQAERDHLVKFIFPQLRKLCESRGVTWGEVDLRWGVTDEQAAEGKVLPVCLEEIKRCRPYFIGLLGERYGWIPESISTDVIEREPWLVEHLHSRTSVTELEILHGVLRNPQMAGHAFFYFRDPKYVESLSDTDKKHFTTDNAEDAEKLRRLKERIRQSKFPVRENYPGPKELGELVLADLTQVVNENWPEGSQPEPLDREAMDHEAYAQSRERVYIGRQEYFDRLDNHAAANDTQPLVILGESGSGKSALLANWVARYRQAHPDALVLQHYIGATSYSADWAAMLRRLISEFKRRLGIQQDIPDQSDALRSAFPNWLYMAGAKVAATPSSHSSKIIIVLDALNQLEDRDGAPDLVWLPPVMPENVRLIVSTLPGRPLDEIQKRHWPTFKVDSLNERERLKLLWRFLRQSGKRLSKARRRRIACAPQSANPLYLRVLLDELRMVRTHEELEERIGDYLKAESPYALYEKVIARWEKDYEGDSDMVGDTLSLLWAARRGLTEAELLDALGKPNDQGEHEPLPRAKWSPLFLAMSDALISRCGLLTFAHDFLRTAVEDAYLHSAKDQRAAHLRLADFFEYHPSQRGISLRKVEEWPHQLFSAQNWVRLERCLTSGAMFVMMINARRRNELAHYWQPIRAVGGDLGKSYVDAFKQWHSLTKPEHMPGIAAALAQFLAANGADEEAEAVLLPLLNNISQRFGDNHPATIELMTSSSELLADRKVRDQAEARSLVQRALDASLKTHGPQHPMSRKLLSIKVELVRRMDGPVAAASLMQQLEAARPEAVPSDDLQERINIATMAGNLGDNARSESLLDNLLQECITRLGREDEVTFGCQYNLAVAIFHNGRQAEAIAIARDVARRSETLLGPTNRTARYAAAVFQELLKLSGDEQGCEAEHSRWLMALGDVYRERNARIPGSLESTMRNLAKSGAFGCPPNEKQLSESTTPLTGQPPTHQVAKPESTAAGLHLPPNPVIQASTLHQPSRELTIPELRDSAVTALKRGLWEAAATYLEKLLQQGEPVETVAPDLITALLNAHETVSPHTVTRIESLLAQLESAGHAALAASLREKLNAKLPPKKPRWKFW